MDESSSSWTRDAVWAAITRDFPGENPEMIMAVIDDYRNDDQAERWGVESAARGRARIQLAILHLSKGDVDRLLYYTDLAIMDFRDVLYWPEPVIPMAPMKPDDTICS
jgi:hypothetical protein